MTARSKRAPRGDVILPTMIRYLKPTALLDFDHPTLQHLVARRAFRELPERDRIGAIYAFVRDEIAFGYNEDDALPASRVLADGYGQCNTKSTLLMALLRASSIPCRFHGATVRKALQKGVVVDPFYAMAPKSILHGYAEVLFEGRFLPLEGVILDAAYLEGLRARFPEERGAFLGYGAGTESLAAPANEWKGEGTFVQRTGIDADFGSYDDPDAFYAERGTNLSGLRAFVFKRFARHVMNRKVQEIRRSAGWGERCRTCDLGAGRGGCTGVALVPTEGCASEHMRARSSPLPLALLALVHCGPSQPSTQDASETDTAKAHDASVDVATPAPRPLDGRVFLQQNDQGWRLRVAFRRTNPVSEWGCTIERVKGCWFQDCARDRSFLRLDSTAPVSVGVFSVIGGASTARATPEADGYYRPAFGFGKLWTPGTTVLTLRAEGVEGARRFEARLTTARPLSGGTAQAVRGADFVFRWDTAGAQAGEEVGVRGEVTESTSPDTDRNVELVCFAPRAAGTLTVPAAMVERLPATVRGQGALYAVAHEERDVEGYPTLLEIADTPSAVTFSF